MSVTINNTGAHSRQIVINGEVGITNIVSSINTALTTLGWTLIDTMSSGSLNMLTTKVYAATNIDSATTPTTKYMIIRYDAPKGFAYISCAESWNATTHIATNECFIWGRNVPMGIQYSNCVIYVWATARYAAFMSVIRGVNGPWQGVFEFEREAVEDTAAAGYPCFGWTSSVTIANPLTLGTTNVSTPACFSVPRTRNGYTGWGAARQFVIQTGTGTYPPAANQVTYGTTVYASAHCGMLGAFGTNTSANVWNTDKRSISSLKLVNASTYYVAGRIYGLKVTDPDRSLTLDQYTINTDSNLFVTDANGAPTVHHKLTMSSGPIGVMNNSYALGNTSYNAPSTTTAYNVSGGVVVHGRYVFTKGATSPPAGGTGSTLINSGVINKLDLDSGVWSIINYPQLGNCITTDIVYDGGIYVYVSSYNSVVRINVVTNAVTSLPVSGGYALAIDDTYLYISPSSSALASSQVQTYKLADLQLQSTYLTPAFSSGTARVYSMTSVDYNGTVAMAVCAGQTSSYGTQLILLTGSTNTATVTTSPYTYDNEVLYYDGTHVVMYSAGTSSKTYVAYLLPSTLSTAYYVSNYTLINQVNMTINYNNNMVPFRGCRTVLPLTAGSVTLDYGKSGATTTGFSTCNFVNTGVIGPTAAMTASVARAHITDGCTLYTGAATNAFVAISGAYDNSLGTGALSAGILIPS